jgi:tRNA threonylcarbamoyladenosine biosynthesis protein TsaB
MSGVWLALDTATDLASVAAGEPPGTLAAALVRGGRRQAAQIVPLVDQVLGTIGIRPGGLAGIVVGDGPGSFTGLRIGWAAARGLAQETGFPLRAIPSLLGAAAAAAQVLGAVPIAACFDALRGQVYGAMYVVRAGGGAVETLVPPSVVTVDELASRAPARPRLVVGDGAMRYAAAVSRWSGSDPVPLEQLAPVAGMLLALVEREGVARTVDDPANAEPVYGRPAEAQAKWEARHGTPLPNPSRRDA